jgi:tetratricopeptide (TPR) repeat protein
MNLSEYNEADECYDVILKVDPKNVNATGDKGTVLASKGNFKSAIAFFDKALEMDPRNIRLIMNKARALEELGDHENAKKCYDEVDRLT